MRFLRWLFTRIFWTSVVMLTWLIVGYSLTRESTARSHRQLIEQGKVWILEDRAAQAEEAAARKAEQQRRR